MSERESCQVEPKLSSTSGDLHYEIYSDNAMAVYKDGVMVRKKDPMPSYSLLGDKEVSTKVSPIK